MLRWLYIQLIWLHPAAFRWRFGDDMLDDFDRARLRGKPRYFADAAASLARQWLLRPEFRRPEPAAAPAQSPLRPASLPLFQTIEPYKPRPAVLLQGGLLAVLSLLAVVAIINKGGGAKSFLIGAHFSRPALFPIDRSSLAAGDLHVSVDPGPDSSAAWQNTARAYFASMPVLRALDTNRDFVLSPSEIGNAPAVLRQVAAGHQGKLAAGECGLPTAPDSPKLRRLFMSGHPVLSALDADGDGEISAREVDHAPAALRKLDRNHDGCLTADELLPSETAARAGLR